MNEALGKDRHLFETPEVKPDGGGKSWDGLGFSLGTICIDWNCIYSTTWQAIYR